LAANESALVARARVPQNDDEQNRIQRRIALGTPMVAGRKLIHNAELGLVVGNVRSVADEILRLTELNHGEVDKSEIVESSGGFLSATLLVRLPASGLESALTKFERLAVRTERMQTSERDVTREFYDNEAHLRNLEAEERQYLVIMKRAGTIKDTLEVSEKLSDVRDRIERLRTQIQLMTHDIEMSLVNIALMQEQDAQVFGIHWRPAYSAKIAIHESLAGMGDWVDWVAAVLIKLPLIALWALTVGGILWALWKMGLTIWHRFGNATAPKSADNSAATGSGADLSG
jgi:Domain of unknown function (DUF4349)